MTEHPVDIARHQRPSRPYGDPNVWRACFDALRPYAPHAAEHVQAARAHALTIVEYATEKPVNLDEPIFGQPRRVLRAALTGWWMGWRAGMLADVLTATGLGLDHSEYTGTGPSGWLLPALGGIQGMLPSSDESAKFAKTVEEEIAWCNRPWAADLDFIQCAHEAVRYLQKMHQQPDRHEELHVALQYVIDRQWRIEIESGYAGWDDAEWHEYLDVRERVPWLIVALGHLHTHPETCGNGAWSVAYRMTQGANDPRAMPDGVIERMTEAMAAVVWPTS